MFTVFYRWLITHKPLILNIFFVMEIGMVLLILIGVGLFIIDSPYYLNIASNAGLMGQISFVLFCTAITPGIIKRLGILTQLQISLMLFRRQFGVTMYLMALNHMAFMFAIPIFLAPIFEFPPLNSFLLYGVASVSLLLPLWVTSNDWSVKKMGKWWKILHGLIYIAVFTIFMHVGLANRSLGAVALVFLILEILSWLKYWWQAIFRKQTSSLPVATTTQSISNAPALTPKPPITV